MLCFCVLLQASCSCLFMFSGFSFAKNTQWRLMQLFCWSFVMLNATGICLQGWPELQVHTVLSCLSVFGKDSIYSDSYVRQSAWKESEKIQMEWIELESLPRKCRQGYSFDRQDSTLQQTLHVFLVLEATSWISILGKQQGLELLAIQ